MFFFGGVKNVFLFKVNILVKGCLNPASQRKDGGLCGKAAKTSIRSLSGTQNMTSLHLKPNLCPWLYNGQQIRDGPNLISLQNDSTSRSKSTRSADVCQNFMRIKQQEETKTI